MQQANMNGFNRLLLTNNTKLYLGDKTYDNLVVDISDVSMKNFPNNEFVGIIGGGVLKNYNLFNNYSDNILILEEVEGQKIEKGKLITDGFRISKVKNKFIVNTIFSIKAEELSISLGDEVIEINNRPIKRISFEELEKIKNTLGKENTYKLKRGREMFSFKATVKDFFKLF